MQVKAQIHRWRRTICLYIELFESICFFFLTYMTMLPLFALLIHEVKRVEADTSNGYRWFSSHQQRTVCPFSARAHFCLGCWRWLLLIINLKYALLSSVCHPVQVDLGASTSYYCKAVLQCFTNKYEEMGVWCLQDQSSALDSVKKGLRTKLHSLWVAEF